MNVNNNKLSNKKTILALLIIVSFLLNPLAIVDGMTFEQAQPEIDVFDSQDWKNGIEQMDNFIRDGASYDENFDLGTVLGDGDNTYKKVWDPWLTKAAIHAIATTDDGDMMALAGGYLYDNEIHLYRWNYVSDQYDLVYEIGSEVFQSDVLTLEFSDIDYNNLTEIIAGTEDGYIYIFEQRHIYDPITNMENQFDLVWQSPRLGRVFDLLVGDPDGDFRQDVIVGTGDMLRFYEYDTHGNYPFGKEHWMELREVFSYKMPSRITALGLADPDYDNLPDIAVGMRSGELVLMENNGTTLDINGYPYPILQDNSYKPVWSSNNTIRRAISDISGGDIDDDGHKELIIAVQGQGAYILDNVDGVIGTFRIERPFTTWEANPIEIYPLDNFADSMINSSSMFNGTLLSAPSDANVYYYNGSYYGEPLNYSDGDFKYPEVYPYSAHSVMLKDGEYTTFNALFDDAWAVYDFGYDEEASSNGVTGIADLTLWVSSNTVDSKYIELSISNDQENWIKINASDVFAVDSDKYEAEVDPALNIMESDYYQYLKVNVTSSAIRIDVIEAKHVNNLIYDALSVEVGSLYMKNEFLPTTVGYIATIDGAILAVDWNPDKGLYEIIWDSWVEERFKLRKNIFDLEMVKKKSRFPAWISYDPQTWSLDTNTLPGEMVSYTADNFFNYKNEDNLEFILSSTDGSLRVYTQGSENGQPTYNDALTQMLFSRAETGMPTVNDYIASSNAKYFSASLIPVETLFYNDYSKYNALLDTIIDPVNNGYWLFLGAWDGNVTLDGVWAKSTQPFVNDVSIWYMNQLPTGSAECGTLDATFDSCTIFTPLANSSLGFKTLTNMELSGVMPGIFRESTWLPKVAGADMIGSEFSDIVLTNGKVHLLETTLSQDPMKFNPEEWINPIDPAIMEHIMGLDAEVLSIRGNTKKYVDIQRAVTRQYTDWSFIYRGDYFFSINNDSKGRVWTNAQLVNFDNDDDFDLILGFARYNTAYFGFDKVTYGMTYFENEGSRGDPVWVEKKKAVTNNDEQSNFRVANFTEPVMVWTDYDFGPYRVFDPIIGYSPLYKTLQPTKLFMLQTSDQFDIFNGKIKPFSASYNHPTSFLAATYPEAKRIDINLLYRNNTSFEAVNYGFHIFESWDNEEELRDWTLSMTTADLDEDGKNEVIVGDFNNNVYVFEHLTNNTYKRAFKSFDVNRTIVTDETPYAHELFGGITGTFKRTVFEHVEQLIAGFDLNQNGRQEFIAATASMIFVFEAVYTLTDRIRDDTYELIAIIDLFDLPQLANLPQDQIRVTTMAGADDLTIDGRRELLVGVNSAFLVFEIGVDADKQHNVNDYFNSPQWQYEEIFFGQTGEYRGAYDLPGNYRMRPNYQINAILVEDLDSDGRMDVVLGGINKASARPIWDGFLTIIEHDGSVFTLMADDDDFRSTIQYTPVNDLAVMDADLDDNKELIVAHDKGITIFEFSGDDTFAMQGVITSDPSYEMPSRYYETLNNEVISHDKDVIRDINGDLLKVYVSKTGAYYDNLIFETSADNGKTWVPHSTISFAGASNVFLEQPSLALGSDGNPWVSFLHRQRVNVGAFSYDVLAIMVSRYTTVWSSPASVNTPTTLNSILKSDISRISPRIFEIPDGTSTSMGLVYNDASLNELHFMSIDQTGALLNGANTAIHPFIDGTDENNFTIHSLDIVRLDSNDFYNQRYDYGLVFSGYHNTERLSMDYDIFYSGITLVDSVQGLYNFTVPTRTFRSAITAYYPSIIEEQDTGNLLVTYESSTLRPYGGLFAIWSNTQGNFWNGPYDMSHPLGFDMPIFAAFPSRSKETYRVGTTIGNMFLNRFEARRPVVAPGVGRGFTMTYSIDFGMGSYSSLGTCKVYDSRYQGDGSYAQGVTRAIDPKQCGIFGQMIVTAYNQWSNFTWFDVGAVQDIAVGDSDRDNRVEILAATGKFAALFEFSSNSATKQQYSQKWRSSNYARDLTAVAISDGNGNGYPELLIESDRGIVNAFEITATTRTPATQVLRPYKEGTISSDNGVDLNLIIDIKTIDINGDGVEDILYKTSAGQIYAINGVDMSTIYQYKDYNNQDALNFTRADIQILRDGGGTPLYIVVAHSNNITLIDFSTGVVQRTILTRSSFTDVEQITSINTIDTGGGTEFVVGFYNGTVIAYDSSLTQLWNYYNVSKASGNINDETVIDIQTGNFTGSSQLQILITERVGWITVLDPSTGNEIWSKRNAFNVGSAYPIFTYFTVGAAVADLDEDGLDDIIVGSNSSFALSGLDGKQLWNMTIYRPLQNETDNKFLAPRPLVTDIDGDGVSDVVYTVYYNGTNGYETTIAINGKNGRTIWTYNPRESSTKNYLATSLTEFELELSGKYSLIAGAKSVDDLYSGNDFAGYILDKRTGIAVAGLPVSNITMEIAVSNLGFGYPVIIIGDVLGNLQLYSLWEGTPEPSFTPVPEGQEEPFIMLESDFTRRTEFLLKDVVKKNSPGKDGIDDIIIIDDDYVGVADTYRLEADPTFNDVFWEWQPTNFSSKFGVYPGQYLGGAKIGDVNNDNFPDIVIPYQWYLVVLDLSSGDLIFNWWYPNGDILDQGFNFELVDWETSDTTPEIVYSRNVIVGTVRYTEFGVIIDDGTGGMYQKWSSRSIAVENPKLGIGDFDADGFLEMMTYSVAIFNPMYANITMFDNDFTRQGWVSFASAGLPPVSNIAVSDFDKTIPGDEMVLFFEFSMIDLPGFAFLLERFPSLMLQFGYDTASSFITLAPSNMIGVAPFEGYSRRVFTTDNLGNRFDLGSDGENDMIVQNRYGDLFTMNFQTGPLLMPITGTYNSLAVPYAKNNVIFGDFCGDQARQDMVVVSAGNAITCYQDDLEFQNVAVANWTVVVDLGVITNLASADLDTGNAVDDIMVVSFYRDVNGSKYMLFWIINDASFAINMPAYVANQQIQGIDNQFGTGIIIGVIGLLSSPFVVLTYRMKYGKKLRSFQK